MDQTKKKCSTCKQIKDRSGFNKNRSNTDGLQRKCRDCQATYEAAYRKSERGREVGARVRAKYQRSGKGRAAGARARAKYQRSGKGRAVQAKYKQSEKGRAMKAKADTQHRFGDARLKNFLFSYQGGLSALTGLPLLSPAIDHCHTTDRVRGLLNEIENVKLSWWGGDTLQSVRSKLSKLKNKDGEMGRFLRMAEAYLQRTPEQVGVDFTVIGKYASRKRTKKLTAQIRDRNTRNLNDALARITSVLEQVA